MKVLAAWTLWPDPPATAGGDRFAPDLVALEAQYVAQRPRRVGRHARLTLVGAAACLKESGIEVPGARTGIYLGSGVGNAAEEALVAGQVVCSAMGVSQGPPSPVHFANSVSNSATFYAARVTGATGPNLVVSQEEVSFEGALMAADLALAAGEVDFALVGGVDECLPDREGVYLRIDLPPDVVLGEGSAWLLVARDGERALGEVLASFQVREGAVIDPPANAAVTPDAPPVDDAGIAWDRIASEVARHRLPGEPVTILPGLRIGPCDQSALATRIPGATLAPYLPRCGAFATAAALGIAGRFADGTAPGLFVHVTRCRIGVAAVVARRHPDAARE
mgnify:CR=1 FL=1